MEIALGALNIGAGDEVIISAHTMIATASAVVAAGATPVPVDIGPDWMIDPDMVENSITERTVGIMPTQLNGRTCNMQRIMDIAERRGLFVVEDAAQALGSKYKGKSAGSFGVAAAFSFYPAKVLGSFGDAGAIVCNKDQIYQKMYQLHDHGRNTHGEIVSWGRNSRLDNLQAAFLLAGLKDYEKAVSRRREIAGIYNERLHSIEQLSLPPKPDIGGDHFDVYQNYEISATSRNELQNHLRKQGVGTLVQWSGKAVHQWEHLGVDASLPIVEQFFEKCLMLPMNTFISDDDVHYVCDQIIKFYGHKL